MWIEITNERTRRLKHPEVDEPVEFTDSGSAQVPAEVGELLIAEYDAITKR